MFWAKAAMKPFPKARPRVSPGHTHMPAAYTAAKVELVQRLRASNGQPLPLFTGPVVMTCWFACKDGRRGDLDNLCAGVADALNGICYHDDKQIVELHGYLTAGANSITVQLEPAP